MWLPTIAVIGLLFVGGRIMIIFISKIGLSGIFCSFRLLRCLVLGIWRLGCVGYWSFYDGWICYSYFMEKLPLPAPMSNFVKNTVPGSIFKSLRFTNLLTFFACTLITIKTNKNPTTNIIFFICILYYKKCYKKQNQNYQN